MVISSSHEVVRPTLASETTSTRYLRVKLTMLGLVDEGTPRGRAEVKHANARGLGVPDEAPAASKPPPVGSNGQAVDVVDSACSGPIRFRNHPLG